MKAKQETGKLLTASIDTYNLDDIKTEDQAIGLLSGLDPNYFESQMLKYDLRIIKDMAPKEREDFNEFVAYLVSQNYCPFWFLSDGNGSLFMNFKKFLQSIRNLNAWNGSFQDYVTSLYNEGVVFGQHIVRALKEKGIYLRCSPDSWPIKFYKRWIDRGVWTLGDAAELYSGIDPHRGREFISFSNPTAPGAGMALWGRDEIFEFDEHEEFINVPNGRWNREMSLLNFVENHIMAGNLAAQTRSGSDEPHFKPFDISDFFRKYFKKSHVPLALFQALGEDEPAADTGNTMASRPDIDVRQWVIDETIKSGMNSRKSAYILLGRDDAWKRFNNLQARSSHKIFYKDFKHTYSNLAANLPEQIIQLSRGQRRH